MGWWNCLLLGVVRRTQGGLGCKCARDLARNLVGYVATCHGLGQGSGTVYFSTARAALLLSIQDLLLKCNNIICQMGLILTNVLKIIGREL